MTRPPFDAARVIDALATTGWYVGESLFSAELTRELADRARQLSAQGQLTAARVGRAGQAGHHQRIRDDETLWLDDIVDDPAHGRTPAATEAAALRPEREAFAQISDLRASLNEALYLGARSAELHFARYRSGAFYRTHRDRFRDDDARLISLVFYLNESWPGDAGGELVLYADDAREGEAVGAARVLQRVSPRAGTMVCFRSERFPHEVLPATRERYSLTGWMRRDGA